MNGPQISEYGDVITSALGVQNEVPASMDLRDNFRLEAGQIERIYTIDDPDNSASGKKGLFTVYDVMIQRPNGSTEIIPRCRLLQPGFGGGLNNFMEVLQNDPGPTAKDPTVPVDLKRGHMVLVGFISGRKDAPVILGAMPHTSPVAAGTRPSKGKGTYLEAEIQGVNFQIDNDGALKVFQSSPKNDQGVPTNASVKTTVHIQKDGSIEISTGAKQKIRIDAQSHHIRIDNGPTYIDMDQDGDKIDVVAKNVNVGTGGLQPQVVGDDLVSWLSDLCDEIALIYVPTGVGPSGTPVNTPKFQALKAAVKEKVQSKKHKVEK